MEKLENKTKSLLNNKGDENFKERSDLSQEIISKKPDFFEKWALSLFLLILLLLATICYFIQYPDIVAAKARLSSTNAPKQVITHTDGKLTKILIQENDIVAKGQVLAYIESLANPSSVIEVSKDVETIFKLINQNRTNEIVPYFPSPSKQNLFIDLGELQTQYQTFLQSFATFKDYLNNGFYFQKRAMLQTDRQNISKLHGALVSQKKLIEQDLNLSYENYKVNEILSNEKVISTVDFRNEKSKLISKQLTLPQINSSIVSNQQQQNEKSKEIAELENQIQVEKNNFIQALLTFKSQIENWQFKYFVKAPIDGTLTYTGFYQENQEIKNGTSLFNIQPANTNYFIEMLIPQYNFGKIKIGQEVLLKFQAYPYEQYGSVIGKIEYINKIPTDSGYLAKVSLPDGLTTNYNKPLQYLNNANASAEIITENMRLIQRFYNNLTKQINSR